MKKPNWFDGKYASKLEKASAQQALELVAKDDRLQKVLTEALKSHDEHAKQQGWVGPSRTQVIRDTIAGCLTSMEA